MTEKRIGVAIIGCGNISTRYAADIAGYPELDLVGVSDLDPERAAALAAEHDCDAYADIDAMLADDRVDIVVNLTIHHAHYEVTQKLIAAGKHVHSEKPLALTPAEAADLVAQADAKGVLLGSSPFTWMGEAQQTAWKQIRDGRLGDVRLVYAEVNHGRIEDWHPDPEPFYDVGPWFDVGVYPLTIATTFFGPAKSVQATGKVVYPNRQTKEDRPFSIETPDCMLAVVELASGALLRLTVNFYVRDTRQVGMEFHGDLGSMHLSSWQGFNAELAYAPYGEGLSPVPPLQDGPQGTEWGRGVRDMAEAVRDNRPHRATGAQAAHVVEILAAGSESARTGQRVAISSTFPQPAPMPWGE
jgi:predicted dehydrogenase